MSTLVLSHVSAMLTHTHARQDDRGASLDEKIIHAVGVVF
jgi:hypothetical protein